MTRHQPRSDPEYRNIIRQYRIAASISVLVVTIATTFYHFVEKLSWLNAIYFSVITLTTVGYGDITPKTDAGKIFTIFYVLTGIGIVATLANLTVKRAIARRERK